MMSGNLLKLVKKVGVQLVFSQEDLPQELGVSVATVKG